MSVYVLFIREDAVRDPSEMEIYQRMNRAAPRDPKITPLVVYGDIEALEGAPPDGMVMVQFPTVEDARAWYNSPAYQAAIPHRKKAADYRAFIVQGL